MNSFKERLARIVAKSDFHFYILSWALYGLLFSYILGSMRTGARHIDRFHEWFFEGISDFWRGLGDIGYGGGEIMMEAINWWPVIAIIFALSRRLWGPERQNYEVSEALSDLLESAGISREK